MLNTHRKNQLAHIFLVCEFARKYFNALYLLSFFCICSLILNRNGVKIGLFIATFYTEILILIILHLMLFLKKI